MFTPSRRPGEWTDDHQFFYSLLWSAFLDLDAYSASRFRRPFFPYSTEFVVSQLLPDDPEVKKLGLVRDPARPPAVCLSPRFVQLALWTVVPQLFGAPVPHPGESRSAERSDDARTALQQAVAQQLRNDLGIDVAAFRFDPDARPLLPPGLGLGIEDAHLTIDAGRRRASARISAAVQVQYEPRAEVARVIDPSTWSAFGYWDVASRAKPGPRDGSVDMTLRLPGGAFASETKTSPLRATYGSAAGPFAARVDFDCSELMKPPPRDAQDAQFERRRASTPHAQADQEQQEREHRHYAKPYTPDAAHVGRLRGYVQIEKIAGRPGWTSFEAQREVRFESPNHDRFRIETLTCWLACDVLSFAEAYAQRTERAP
jgi:hypothetical protein